jgi:hypothetical protein
MPPTITHSAITNGIFIIQSSENGEHLHESMEVTNFFREEINHPKRGILAKELNGNKTVKKTVERQIAKSKYMLHISSSYGPPTP